MTQSKKTKGFLVVLPGEIIEIPQDSHKSWLTLFYNLPKELAEKWKPTFHLPRCPYEVLRTDKYDSIICDDMFKLLVWDCYSWSVWQFFQVKDRKGNYRDIPGDMKQYAGLYGDSTQLLRLTMDDAGTLTMANAYAPDQTQTYLYCGDGLFKHETGVLELRFIEQNGRTYLTYRGYSALPGLCDLISETYYLEKLPENEIYEYTDVILDVLPEELREEIREGKYLKGEEELYNFLENYTS